MPDFLLEIGCEEIPARMLDGAYVSLTSRLVSLIVKERLSKPPADLPAEEIFVQIYKCFATPRRLGLFVPGLADAQPDITERVMGPPVKVAFKDGKPTPAAEAFATKAGVSISQLEHVNSPKGEYLAATVTKKGRTAAEVLAEVLSREIAAIHWDKNMYWRPGKPEHFSRPIRWLVAMIGASVIPVEFAGVRAARQTRGHRILSSGAQKISAPDQYEAVLAKAGVVADPNDRQQIIRKALDAAARSIPGARWREDVGLLRTLVYLTEWPSVILGNFDRQFLSLPEEVLATVMRDHQKYFVVEDASGKLVPNFLAVLNTDGDPDGLIRHGNERVLRARFSDAQFFWNTDQKMPLVNRVEMLSHVTFQKDLGSYQAKAERVGKLAQKVGAVLGKAGSKIDAAALQQAVALAKTDLTTELVKEFTELQGIIGGLYARAQGLPQAVADAIYDQYKPAAMEDSAPRTLEGAVLAIGDKADSIAGMFALGLVPSGSKDPFALRRQANGIVKTIAEHKLPLSIAELMADARRGYSGDPAEKKFTLAGEAYPEAVSGFFRERLEFYLRDALGLAYDVVNATLAADPNDVVDAIARATAVAKVRPSTDFESISTSFKRMKNILHQAREGKKRISEKVDISALAQPEEKQLAEAVPKIANDVNMLRAKGDYDSALLEISRLRPMIDAFFDKVMVMVDDESLRANRLGLLQTLVTEFSRIADFSEIVTGKEAIRK